MIGWWTSSATCGPSDSSSPSTSRALLVEDKVERLLDRFARFNHQPVGKWIDRSPLPPSRDMKPHPLEDMGCGGGAATQLFERFPASRKRRGASLPAVTEPEHSIGKGLPTRHPGVENSHTYVCGQSRCRQAASLEGVAPWRLLRTRGCEPGPNQLPPCPATSAAQANQSPSPASNREGPAALYSHLGPGQS